MELYILSKKDLSILSICKLADYQINLDEETNAKSTFTLMKTNGLKKENYMVLNGLYRQFIFVIDNVQTEKGSNVVTVTALDISNIFDRKVIEKNIDTMKSKSIEEFLANTISENFVNSDDTALNVNYIEIYWHTNTQGNVATNAENGLYNFHTFLINCRQYKNIYTDFKLENLGNPQTVEGKRINVEAKNRKIVDIMLEGESQQATRSGKNLFDKDNANIINTYLVGSGNGVLPSDGGVKNNCIYIPCKTNTTYTIQKMIGKRFGVAYTYNLPAQGVTAYNKTVDNTATNITITTDSSANYLVVYLRNGNVNGEITLQQALDSLQIEQGTTATEYEPYGVMPSPDYPSEIENIEGNIEFKVEGKNLVKQINWKQLPSITTGATVTTVNGYGTDFIEIDNTKNYVFSYSGTAGSKYVAYYGESKNFLGYSTNLQIDNYEKWNTTKYVKLRIDCPENAVTNIQLEEGTTATDYEPHKSQVATFPLGEGQKLMEGSYLADDGIHHKRKQVVLDGSESSWRENGVTKGLFQVTLSNVYVNNNTINAMSNLLVGNTGTNIVQANSYVDNSVATFSNNRLFFRINTYANNLNGLKSWLSSNSLTVEYELAEEEIVAYTEEQKEAWNKIKNLTLFEGVNHISSDANMVLKYYPLEPVGLKFVLRIDIENKQETTKLIDTTLPEVTDYNKVYEEDVTAKVTAYIRENNTEYNLYLKTDRTTTTNKNDPDRASGKIEVISVDTVENAQEKALNVMKGNNYKHLVEFKIAKTSKLMDITELHIGRPIRIKTDDDIYDSYISAITLSDENFVYFKSGSLRITLLDKLKKLVIL